ncbi:BTB/POZ domain-containing protein 17-like [Babylonia areolata]|uniref:BTB/POZ domain-containing protein 17-like n=1 Tax=Babylonia areolata TaxID=304850 RepID=UPI003FCF2516
MGNVFSRVKRRLHTSMAMESKVRRVDTGKSGGTMTVHDSEDVVQRYKNLFMQERLSDIVLRVGDQRFHAHRFVLITASGVFEAMLSERRWKEAQQPEICLTEEEECVPQFEHFLGYLYSGEVVLKTTTVLPLLLLADKYEVDCLRRSCLTFMMDHIVQSPDTNRALTWYQYAQMTCQHELRERCLGFILSNFDTVMQAGDWPYMVMPELLAFLAASDMVVESEAVLWGQVERWLLHEHNKDQLEDNLREVLPHIRFMMMPPKHLLRVEQSSLCTDHKDLFADKLNLAYRKHSLAMDEEDASADDDASPSTRVAPEPYRNYTSEVYCVSHKFSLPGYATINKIDSRISLDCKARHRFVSSSRERQEDMTLFSVYFFPRGYFTTLTIYGSYMGRQTGDVTLKVIRRRPDLPPMKVEVTLMLLGKQNQLKYAALTHSWCMTFSKESHTLSVEKFVAVEKLMEENSPYLVDGTLEGTIFLKVQDVGNHLLDQVKEVKDKN